MGAGFRDAAARPHAGTIADRWRISSEGGIFVQLREICGVAIE